MYFFLLTTRSHDLQVITPFQELSTSFASKFKLLPTRNSRQRVIPELKFGKKK